MKKILPILFLAAATQGCIHADNATNLLNQVKAKYAKCTSFYGQGTSTWTSDMQGTKGTFQQEVKFSIRFQRPNLLRVDWIEPKMFSFSPITNSLYTSNSNYYTVTSYRRTPKKAASLEMAMGAMAGVSGENSFLIPSLLLGRASYLDKTDASARELPPTTVHGHKCDVLELTSKHAGTLIFYVNQRTTGIVRIRQIQHIDVKALRAEMQKALKNQKLPKFNLPKHDFSIKRKFDFTAVHFNQKMRPADFVFPTSTHH